MADQTIGISSNPTSFAGYEGYNLYTQFTTPAVGGGGTCTFYVYVKNGASPYPSVKCGVWADSSDNPGALLATGPTLAPTSNAEGFLSGTFTWNNIQANTKYWLGISCESTAGAGDIGYFGTGTGAYQTSTYPNLPDPAGTHSDFSRTYGLKVVYPEAATTTLPPFLLQSRMIPSIGGIY